MTGRVGGSALLPIPAPVDEFAGLLVARRVASRIAAVGPMTARSTGSCGSASPAGRFAPGEPGRRASIP